MSEFEARFYSWCEVCEGRIKIGDLLTYTSDDLLSHAECPVSESIEPVGPVCHACWQAKAINGKCGCE